MQALASTILALSLVAPDPRTIDPDSSSPEIVTEGGEPATAPVIPTVPPPAGAPPKPPPVVPDGPPPPNGGTDDPPVDRPGPVTPDRVPVATPQPQPDNVDRTVGCFAARGRCRRLNVAGFSVLGAGLAFLGVGIGFTRVAPFPIDEEPVFNRSLAPAGKALVGVGVAALLSGALLIGSGFAVHRKFKSGEEQLARVRVDGRGLHW